MSKTSGVGTSGGEKVSHNKRGGAKKGQRPKKSVTRRQRFDASSKVNKNSVRRRQSSSAGSGGGSFGSGSYITKKAIDAAEKGHRKVSQRRQAPLPRKEAAAAATLTKTETIDSGQGSSGGLGSPDSADSLNVSEDHPFSQPSSKNLTKLKASSKNINANTL